MGFMDKVKAAAQDVASEAKQATAKAQTKMEQSQTRKKIDELAKQLGYLTYREKTQGTPAGADADKLIADMGQLEKELADSQAAAAAPASDASTPPASEPAGGDTTS
jgi:membrane protein involved in colicin uptake